MDRQPAVSTEKITEKVCKLSKDINVNTGIGKSDARIDGQSAWSKVSLNTIILYRYIFTSIKGVVLGSVQLERYFLIFDTRLVKLSSGENTSFLLLERMPKIASKYKQIAPENIIIGRT